MSKKIEIRNNDINKDLLIKRFDMGELTQEILTKYRSYSKNKKAQLFEMGFSGDELEKKLRYYCASWLRDKKPTRMSASNKRRRNCPKHKATAKASKYARRNGSLWGFSEAMWNDYAFADLRRTNPKKVMWKNRQAFYDWLVATLEEQNGRSAMRNQRGVYPKMTRKKDGNLSREENFKNATNISVDRILPHLGYVKNNVCLIQRQQNKDKNAIHLYQAEDTVRLQRKAKKKMSKRKK
jgi:hypothetical protein